MESYNVWPFEWFFFFFFNLFKYLNFLTFPLGDYRLFLFKKKKFFFKQ